jgi:hypothetical protein
MLTENGIEVDMDALRQLLETADVLTIGFGAFAERLLIDTRTEGETGPLIAIVPPVASVQERYLWLGQHRGQFGVPKAFSFFFWPHSVRGLDDRAALEPLRQRLRAASRDGEEMLDNAIRTLRSLEYRAIASAISGGDGWGTLWARANISR